MSTTTNALWLVTGASRGLGRAIVDAAAAATPRATILAVARDAAKLAELKAAVESDTVTVVPVELDLTSPTAATDLRTVLDEVNVEGVDEITVVHNAGSLGNLNHIKDLDCDDVTVIQTALTLNVASPIALTSCVLKWFGGRELDSAPRLRFVNISSLLAVQTFKGWSLYATGKAAREMFFKTLAAEEGENGVRILNYSPGPLDTDMQGEVRETMSDPEQKAAYSTMHSEGKLLTCQESVAKMMKVLAEDSYENAAHVDVYDVE